MSTELKEKRKRLILTAKQEQFCLNFVSSKMTMAEAYAEAYGKQGMGLQTLRVRASELVKTEPVAKRIQELRERAAEKAVVTLEGHLRDLLALRNKAAQLGQLGAAIGAEIARGKAAGVHVEKSEVIQSFKELPASVHEFV